MKSLQHNGLTPNKSHPLGEALKLRSWQWPVRWLC